MDTVFHQIRVEEGIDTEVRYGPIVTVDEEDRIIISPIGLGGGESVFVSKVGGNRGIWVHRISGFFN